MGISLSGYDVSPGHPGIAGSYKFLPDQSIHDILPGQPEIHGVYTFLNCSAIVGFLLKLHN
jgi:hypothetical protein